MVSITDKLIVMYKVVIEKCSKRFGWYRNKIGQEFVVDSDFCVVDNKFMGRHIDKRIVR